MYFNMQFLFLPFIFFLRNKKDEHGVECCILILFNKNQVGIAVMDKSLTGFHFFPF